MAGQNIKLTLSLPFTIKKREKWYLSCCPVLDVFSQGETREKAIENLIEALELFILSCFERGTLDAVLKECGFSPVKRKRKSPDTDNYIDVPIHLFFDKNASIECHA
jgi:predicted RNase H-like HicB family nuclease